MNALETYLEELYAIRSSGGAVKETSYYPALSTLLNEVGKTLKPRVRCIINIQNAGAGLPDGGLYATEQFQRQAKGTLRSELREGQMPARGAIEVKSTGEEVKNIAGSEQVMRYVNRYKQVLVTPILTCGRISFNTLQSIDEQNSLAHSWHTKPKTKAGGPSTGRPRLFDN